MPVDEIVQAAAVALVPLAALGALLMAVSASWSRRIGPVVSVVAAAGAAAIGVARSGDRTAEVLGVLLAIAATAVWLHDRGIPGNRRRPWLVRVLALALAVCAAGAIVAALSG